MQLALDRATEEFRESANLEVLHQRQLLGCIFEALNIIIIILHSDQRDISTQLTQLCTY